MKFSWNDLLILCWGLVNLSALVMIGFVYFLVWHTSAKGASVTPERVQFLANAMSRDQLAKMFVDQDLALRGAMKAFYLTLHVWLDLTLINICLTLVYCYRHRYRITALQ